MERKIGETFEFEGKTYKVVKFNGCANCAFKYNNCPNLTPVIGNCIDFQRSDGAKVMFEEIKDNKLTINIPEGMKIDIENSDLKAGVIKFMKKRITYKDVYNRLNILGKHIVVTPNNIQKLIAIGKLLDIARYYNGDWKPDWSNKEEEKWNIYYSNLDSVYDISSDRLVSSNTVYFKHKEDAQAVIDNPNFREILDAIFKN